MEAKFPVLKVLKVLDRTTLVLSGSELDKVRVGEDLVVLGQGPLLDEIGGVPLILIKARVEVTANAGDYLIASPPGRKVEESVSSIGTLLGGLAQTRTVVRREPLQVLDADLTGNPASRAVAVGDPVIRDDDYKSYVQLLKNSPKAGTQS